MLKISDVEIHGMADRYAYKSTNGNMNASFVDGSRWYRMALEDRVINHEPTPTLKEQLDAQEKLANDMAQSQQHVQSESNEQTTRIHKVEKFTFPSIKNGDYFTMDGKTKVLRNIYHKFADGNNWSEFSREELEYIVSEEFNKDPTKKYYPNSTIKVPEKYKVWNDAEQRYIEAQIEYEQMKAKSIADEIDMQRAAMPQPTTGRNELLKEAKTLIEANKEMFDKLGNLSYDEMCGLYGKDEIDNAERLANESGKTDNNRLKLLEIASRLPFVSMQELMDRVTTLEKFIK